MKLGLDSGLVALFIDALKVPHIAMLFGMLGVLAIAAWVFVAFLRTRTR